MPNALVGLDVWTYLPLCVQVSVSGLGRCEVDLQHLYLGHVAVDSWRYPGTGMDASYRLTGHVRPLALHLRQDTLHRLWL